MKPQVTLKRKQDFLKNKLNEDIEKKNALEHQINNEFKELKKLEISIERTSSRSTISNEISET
jgi:hypothetical protein